VTCTLLADISQPAEQASRRRIVVRQVDEQTQCLDANVFAITVFVRGQKPSDIYTQPIIILPRTAVRPSPPGLARRRAYDKRQTTPAACLFSFSRPR
jgi:hypothetical protein